MPIVTPAMCFDLMTSKQYADVNKPNEGQERKKNPEKVHN